MFKNQKQKPLQVDPDIHKLVKLGATMLDESIKDFVTKAVKDRCRQKNLEYLIRC